MNRNSLGRVPYSAPESWRDLTPLRCCTLCSENYRDSTGHDYEKCVKWLEEAYKATMSRAAELTRSLAEAIQYREWQRNGTIDTRGVDARSPEE